MTWHPRVGPSLGCILLLAACGSDDSVGSTSTSTGSTEPTGAPTGSDPGAPTSDSTPTEPGSTGSTSRTDSTGTIESTDPDASSTAMTTGDTTSGPVLGAAICGNGLLDPGEECDLGDNNVPDDMPVEYGCGNHCQTYLYCGDGVVQEDHEDCDVKDSEGFCTETCRDIYLVFLTSELFSGDLDGTTGADQKCTAAGAARVPNGVFQAWLLGPGDTLESRFGMFYPQPQESEDVITFRDPRKDSIADSFQELAFLDGKVGVPKLPIVRTELFKEDGEGCPEDLCNETVVWSNIDDAGNDSGVHCSGWTSGDGMGTYGKNSAPEQMDAWKELRLWTSYLHEKRDCREKWRLYCIQVGFKDK